MLAPFAPAPGDRPGQDGWGPSGPIRTPAAAPGYGGLPPGDPWGQPGGGRDWPLGGLPGGPSDEPESSSKALTALLLSIASFVICPLIAAIAAIVLAGQATREIRESGGRLTGSGKAAAGRILGWVNIVVVVVGLVAGVVMFPRLLAGLSGADPYAKVKAAGPGTCINDTDKPEIVPCAGEHDGEQFAVVELSGETYPGDAQVDAEAERRCRAEFKAYVGQPFEAQAELDAFTITPRKQTWDDGDRSVSCVLTGAKGARLTGSRRGAGAADSP